MRCGRPNMSNLVSLSNRMRWAHGECHPFRMAATSIEFPFKTVLGGVMSPFAWQRQRTSTPHCLPKLAARRPRNGGGIPPNPRGSWTARLAVSLVLGATPCCLTLFWFPLQLICLVVLWFHLALLQGTAKRLETPSRPTYMESGDSQGLPHDR